MIEAFVNLNKKKDNLEPKDKRNGKEYLIDITSDEIHKKEKNDHEILRLTKDTNNIIRFLVKKYLSFDLSDKEKKVLAKSEIQKLTRDICLNREGDIRGINNAFQVAIYYLESMIEKNNEKLTSNDYLDAFHKIDYVKLVYEVGTNNIIETYFIQVKSREMKNEAELNRIISGRVNVGDTDYNESEKFYILRAQEMYKELENKALEKLKKLYLDEESKDKIFEEIRKSKLRNRKGEILNRPDTEESIYTGYKKLVLEAKIIYKNQEEIDKKTLAIWHEKMSPGRLRAVEEINDDLFEKNRELDLENKDEKYLEVFKNEILPILELGNKMERISRLTEYYEAYIFKKEAVTKEDFLIYLELSQDKLNKLDDMLIEKKYIYQNFIYKKENLKKVEEKANIITSRKFYGIIAYPNKFGIIVEKTKDLFDYKTEI